MRKETKGKLPPYAELKRLVLEERLSYQTIGDRYGCHWQAVYATLKRRAHAYGDPWPMQSKALIESKKAIGNFNRYNKLPKNDLIRLEIMQFLEEHSMNVKEFSRNVGIGPSAIYNIINQKAKHIDRDRAELIMAYIEANEKARVNETPAPARLDGPAANPAA